MLGPLRLPRSPAARPLVAGQAQFAAQVGYFPSRKSSSTVPALDQVRNRVATDVVTQVLLKKISLEDGARQLKLTADKALKEAAP